jgi:uncharacterized protein YecE (DUF72 family)
VRHLAHEGEAHRRARSGPHTSASHVRIRIGTSGWTYADWRGRFFPQDVARKNWLAWYATQFATTEINGSFYRTPSLEAVEGWHDQTPPGFQFAWKASKFITHWKRLGETSKDSLELMETRLSLLGTKCGPVLFQLPARFTADIHRLADFIAMLSRRRRYTFEFRHRSWYDDAIFDLLGRHKIALCISDHHDAPSPWVATAPHVYIRAHGPTGRYKGSYPRTALAGWADRIEAWDREGRSVFLYFDNDQKSAAPRDAAKLLALLRATKA